MKDNLSILIVFSLSDYHNTIAGLNLAIKEGATEQMSVNKDTIDIAAKAAHMTAKKLGHTIALATIVDGKHAILKH